MRNEASLAFKGNSIAEQGVRLPSILAPSIHTSEVIGDRNPEALE